MLLPLLMAAGCGSRWGNGSLDEERERQYALNSQLMAASLGHLVSVDPDTFYATKELHALYGDSDCQRLWTPDLVPTVEADTLLRVLERGIAKAGFSAKAFHLAQIREDLDSTYMLSTDSLDSVSISRLARLEYQLTKAYLYYTRGQRYGFIEHPENTLNRAQAECLASEQHIVEAPADFASQALQKARDGQAMGFVQESEPSNPLYCLLQEKLDKTIERQARHKVMANMERARWHNPNQPGKNERHLLVNTAAQQLWAVSEDTVIQMRVVCGARRTKTPMIKDQIGWIVVNPQWSIPAKIVRNEISRHGGDSGYFARHRYFITNGKGDTIPSKQVTVSQLQANQYRVTQHRGPGNSLGRLKFNLTNPYHIYLHDTNTPGAFSYANRALSHGCVRVQRPFDLACFLLHLNLDTDEKEVDRLRVAIGMKPTTEKEQKWLEENQDNLQKVYDHFGNRAVKPAVPVYIIYYTIYPNPEDGKLQTWDDPYGYDDLILRSIKPFL